MLRDTVFFVVVCVCVWREYVSRMLYLCWCVFAREKLIIASLCASRREIMRETGNRFDVCS